MPRPIALVTGASSGLGETFAQKLAGKGFDLILIARREERLHEVAAKAGVQVQIVVADLASISGISAVEKVIRETPGLELLVNNAGFGTKGRFWTTDFSSQVDMHEVHIMAALRLSRAALEGMVARRVGAIINVSSVAAFVQSPGNVSYCATKAWMNSFTEGLAMELRSAGSPVKVQALCPGFTHTGFHETMQFKKAAIPRWLWMNADYVVDASLRGLEQDKVVVIPNWKYKATTAIMRHLPLALRLRLGRPGQEELI